MSVVQLLACTHAMILVASLAGAQPAEPRPLPDNPRPQIPQAAVADAVIGFVDLSVTVKPDGRPGSVRIVNVVPRDFGFEKEAKTVMSRWRFDPAPGAPARLDAHLPRGSTFGRRVLFPSRCGSRRREPTFRFRGRGRVCS